MTTKKTGLPELTLTESIDKLFVRFLVGKNKIYKEEEYNDGLLENESEGNETTSSPAESGWNQHQPD